MNHDESAVEADAEPTPDRSEHATSMEPTNKKADDDAIRAFIADSETGVIATEVAEAFDLGETTVREALSRLEDRGELASRKASVIRLYYVPTSEQEAGTGTEIVEPASEGVTFLTDAQRAYLRDGTLNETTEPDLLGGLREHFAKTLWLTPCLDGLDREEIELLARRLDIPSEEVPALKPNELFEQLDKLAVSIGTPIDRLYSTIRTPSMDVLRWVRRERLDRTQNEIATRLAKIGDLSQASYVTRLSQWESKGRSISEEDRTRLATIYRDIYAEDHDPYQLRGEWDWPRTTDPDATDMSDSPTRSSESEGESNPESKSESDSDSDSADLPSATRRVNEADAEETVSQVAIETVENP